MSARKRRQWTKQQEKETGERLTAALEAWQVRAWPSTLLKPEDIVVEPHYFKNRCQRLEVRANRFIMCGVVAASAIAIYDFMWLIDLYKSR